MVNRAFPAFFMFACLLAVSTVQADEAHEGHLYYKDHRSINDESSSPVSSHKEHASNSSSHGMDHSAMHHHDHGASHQHDHGSMDHAKPVELKSHNHEKPEGMNHEHMDMNMNKNDDMDMGHDCHGMHMPMNGSSMHGMPMWFHAGVDVVILFEQWKVKTVGGLIASMFGIMLIGILYEGLKYFREYLFKQYISSMQFSTVAVTGESGRVTQVHKVEKHRMLSLAHTIQTTLHVVQIVLSYFLMLIFMTYNVWLCLSVVLGSGIGYFMFGWRKATVVDITEHCH